MQNLRKSDLPRCTSCQNPHNHQVAAVFGFAVRLASHLFLEILLSAIYDSYLDSMCARMLRVPSSFLIAMRYLATPSLSDESDDSATVDSGMQKMLRRSP